MDVNQHSIFANRCGRSGKCEFVGFDNSSHKWYLPQKFLAEWKDIGVCELRVSSRLLQYR